MRLLDLVFVTTAYLQSRCDSELGCVTSVILLKKLGTCALLEFVDFAREKVPFRPERDEFGLTRRIE